MTPVFPDMKALQAMAGGASPAGKATPEGATGDALSSGGQGEGRATAARVPAFADLVDAGRGAETPGEGDAVTLPTGRIDRPATARPFSAPWQGAVEAEGSGEDAPRPDPSMAKIERPAITATPSAPQTAIDGPSRKEARGDSDGAEVAATETIALPVDAKTGRPASTAGEYPDSLASSDLPGPDRATVDRDAAPVLPVSDVSADDRTGPAPERADAPSRYSDAPRDPASGIRTEAADRASPSASDMPTPRAGAAPAGEASVVGTPGPDGSSDVPFRPVATDSGEGPRSIPSNVDGTAPAARPSADAMVQRADRPSPETTSDTTPRAATTDDGIAALGRTTAGDRRHAPVEADRAGQVVTTDMPGSAAPAEAAPAIGDTTGRVAADAEVAPPATAPIRQAAIPDADVPRPAAGQAGGASAEVSPATAGATGAAPISPFAAAAPAPPVTAAAPIPPVAPAASMPPTESMRQAAAPSEAPRAAERQSRLRDAAPVESAAMPQKSYASPDRYAVRSTAPRDDVPVQRVANREVDPYSIAATMNEPVTSAEAAKTLAASVTTPAPVVQAIVSAATPPSGALALAAQMTMPVPVEDAASKAAPGGPVDGIGESQVGLVSRGGDGGADVRQVTAPARPTTAEGGDALQEIVRAAVVTKGPTTIELRLDPSELGKIDIELSFNDDRVSIMVRGERDDALDLMRRSSDELGRMLRQARLDLDTLGFSRDQAGGGDREGDPRSMAVEVPGDGTGDGPGDIRDAAYAAIRTGVARDRVDIRI